jgi:hypothetical protein
LPPLEENPGKKHPHAFFAEKEESLFRGSLNERYGL